MILMQDGNSRRVRVPPSPYRAISEVLREFDEKRDRARARRQIQIWMVNCKDANKRQLALMGIVKKMI